MRAEGISRWNASAPSGAKNGSCFPKNRQQLRLLPAKVILTKRIARDVAFVVQLAVPLRRLFALDVIVYIDEKS
jgi:hypothetical protein